MPDELKPCPFCGGSPVEARVSWGYYVRCRACIATGGVEDSPQKARDKWNCRAYDTAGNSAFASQNYTVTVNTTLPPVYYTLTINKVGNGIVTPTSGG